jgi:hypothetical protein
MSFVRGAVKFFFLKEKSRKHDFSLKKQNLFKVSFLCVCLGLVLQSDGKEMKVFFSSRLLMQHDVSSFVGGSVNCADGAVSE